MSNGAYIKNPRQFRALQALLKGAVAVKDLRTTIGALNPAQVIFELRSQGFRGIIKTQRFQVTDQDGKQCCPGEYHIDENSKPIVEEVLKKYAAQAPAGCYGATEESYNININGRGC